MPGNPSSPRLPCNYYRIAFYGRSLPNCVSVSATCHVLSVVFQYQPNDCYIVLFGLAILQVIIPVSCENCVLCKCLWECHMPIVHLASVCYGQTCQLCICSVLVEVASVNCVLSKSLLDCFLCYCTCCACHMSVVYVPVINSAKCQFYMFYLLSKYPFSFNSF